jgi:hypothetical protein
MLERMSPAEAGGRSFVVGTLRFDQGKSCANGVAIRAGWNFLPVVSIVWLICAPGQAIRTRRRGTNARFPLPSCRATRFRPLSYTNELWQRAGLGIRDAARMELAVASRYGLVGPNGRPTPAAGRAYLDRIGLVAHHAGGQRVQLLPQGLHGRTRLRPGIPYAVVRRISEVVDEIEGIGISVLVRC